MKAFHKIVLTSSVATLTTAGLYKIMSYDRWDAYYQNKLNEPAREFVAKTLQVLPHPHQVVAIDLGAGVGHETLLLLEKGYHVKALDNQKAAFEFMLKRPEIVTHKDRLTTITSSFENLDFNQLPAADIIVASFSLPFCRPENFDSFWINIVQKIKPGGYFIGNTFDPGFTVFAESDRIKMTFHTKAQTAALFKGFKIISLNEIQKEATIPGKQDHYYEIFAQKL